MSEEQPVTAMSTTPTTKAGKQLLTARSMSASSFRLAVVGIEREAVADLRASLAAEVRAETCERSESGLLCDVHGAHLFPSVGRVCNGYRDAVLQLIEEDTEGARHPHAGETDLRARLRSAIGTTDTGEGLPHFHEADGKSGVFVDRQAVLDAINKVLG